MTLKYAALYSIADALQIALRPDNKTKIKQVDPTEIALGPWKIKANIYIESVYVTDKTAGVFVHIHRDVWLFIANDLGRVNPLRAYIFDGGTLGLRETNLALYSGISEPSTLIRLAASVKSVFLYQNGEWCVPDNRIDVPAGKGIQNAGVQPQE